MAKSIAAKTGQKLDINQQCLSEGVANLTGSFFQCFPGSGSLTRSYINHQAGAATQWSGVICAGMVALTVLALAPLAQFIPKAALAGVLMVTATRMVDVAGIKYHCRATRFDAAIVVRHGALGGARVGRVLHPRRHGPVVPDVRAAGGARRDDRAGHDRRAPHPRARATATPRARCIGSTTSRASCSSARARSSSRTWSRSRSSSTTSVRVLVLRVKHLRNPDAVCMHLLEGVHRAHRGARRRAVPVRRARRLLHDAGEGGHRRPARRRPRLPRSAAGVDEHDARRSNGPTPSSATRLCETCPRRDGDARRRRTWHFVI